MTHLILSLSLLLLLLSVAHTTTASGAPISWQRQQLQTGALTCRQRIAFIRGGSANEEIISTTVVSGVYELLEEKTVYSKWRILYQRLVRMSNGKIVDFDVVGQKGADGAAIIFAWDSQTKTATMLREYNPGPHRVLCGLAAGLIEEKHGNPKIAAACELEEEVHLAGGTWYELTKSPLAMDKYATTMIHAFLVIDPEHVENPQPLDDEEEIEILRHVTVDEIRNMIREGDMNVVGSWAALLGLEKLRELGEIQ
jgi:hypothetical protein